MTEYQLRSKVANWLVAYKGIREGSAKHKEILSIFNNSGLCTRYTMKTSDAWCATAVSAAFIACGLAGKPGSGSLFEAVDCGCDRVINMAKTQGIWTENDAYVPIMGDVILYDWNDSGSGDNTGSADHIGIVTACNGTTITVIEGNISDTVGYRTLKVNGRYIRGFVTPKYSKFASTASGTSTITVEEITSPDEKEETEVQTYRNGSTEETVYQNSSCSSSVVIGSLNPYEECKCYAKIGDAYLVSYNLDGTSYVKTGFVKYNGGCTF